MSPDIRGFDQPLTMVLRTVVEDLGGTAGLLLRHAPDDDRLTEAGCWPANSDQLDRLRSVAARMHQDHGVLNEREPSILRVDVADAREPSSVQTCVLPFGKGTMASGIICALVPVGSAGSPASDPGRLGAYSRQISLSIELADALSRVTEQLEQRDLMLAAGADGMMMVDSERRIVDLNRSLERLSGWKRREALGRWCGDVLQLRDTHGADMCRVGCPLQSGGGQSVSLEATLVQAGGHQVQVGISYMPVVADSTGERYTVVTLRDVGHSLAAEEFRYQLLATVSHKLQTPISVIKAYAGILSQSGHELDADAVRDKLEVIEEECDHLSQLVSKILYSSRLEAGQIKLNRTEFHLGTAADQIARRLAARAGNRRIKVSFEAGFPAVFVDPDKMNEVMTNLVENAIKFSQEESTISIEGHVVPHHVTVSVADEGLGIPDADQPHVFERFYRVEDSAIRSTPGTGLGLHICKSLVEAHGGQIWVESEPGRGSRFTFAIPRMDRPERGQS